jgi:hypothetical protein
MNLRIEDYFDSIEIYLIQNPIISTYEVIRKEISPIDGKLRIKAFIENNSTLEFFIYISELNQEITQLKYSYHWQDFEQKILRRWDNAPHHLSLSNAPHHEHLSNGIIEPSFNIPDFFFVIEQIELILRET